MKEGIEHTIPGERAETATGRRLDGSPLVKRGAVTMAMVAFIGFALWSMRDQERQAEPSQAPSPIRQTRSFEPAKEVSKVVEALPDVTLPTPVATEPAAANDDPLLDSARRAPVIAFGGHQTAATVRGDTTADDRPDYLPIEAAGGGFTTPDEDEDQRFNRLMRPTSLEGSRAGTLGNRNFVVAMGTSIPCVLETALASDQPGFASCLINRDVLSDNGRVVLMEKGTQVVGEYRGGLKRGQERLFVLWSRAKTPAGIIIALASPATDALGRVGMDGHVESHWWERFGSALLLSIVGDASSYVGRRLDESDVDAQDTTSAGQRAAAIAVEQSINISPTLNKHQGELVSIFVARDLDFSGVYSLRMIEPVNRIRERAVLGDFGRRPTLVTK
ncbi:type IV secretion system protein VirB10 [Sinorhizobium fredii]|uniref:type IV secretion system protein VirB10 n=1 Tax=Rhizobium fredii TaxID=380 RepID=UPI00339A7AAE